MLFTITTRDDLEKLEELASLKNQVEELRLQNKLGEQNFHENSKQIYEPLTDMIEDISQDITKTMTETSIYNNKTLDILKDKLLEILNDGGVLASFLLSPLSKITNPEHTRQIKIETYPSSNRVNDLLIRKQNQSLI